VLFYSAVDVSILSGLYYSSGAIDTVSRAYDILGPMNKWKGEQTKIKALQIGTFNMKYKIKIQFLFSKTKIPL
jgi:hypothetical protein